jgi:hypothetical protein
MYYLLSKLFSYVDTNSLTSQNIDIKYKLYN